MIMKKSLFLTALFVAALSWAMAQTVVFSDNFDSYTAGSRLAQSSTAAWTTWNNAPGSAEDAAISSTQAASAPNSLYITGSNDIIYPFANQTSGHYKIEYDYYVPSSGSGAYFNIQHYYAPGTQWALECFFYNSGSGYLSVGGVEHTFSYPANTWFHVENDIDLDLDSAKLIINDVVVAVWPFSYQQSSTTGGINQLGSINFYAGAPNNATGTYYVDNFSVTELTAAAAPSIAVTPDEDIILTDLDYTTTSNYSFSINNTGDAPLSFRIVPTYNITTPNYTSTGASTFSYDLDEYTSISFTNGAQWEAAIGVPAEDLINHIGRSINQVQVRLSNTAITTAKIRIYKMGNLITEGPGEMIYEQDFYPVDGWNNVTLNTPVVIDGGDLWASVWIDQPVDGGGVGCDDSYQADYYGNWTKSGPSWYRLSENNADLPYNWNIKVIVDGTPITRWIAPSLTTGNIIATDHQDITVGLAGNNVLGNRTGALHIYSNDFEHPEIEINIDATFINVGINNYNQIEITLTPNPATENISITSEQITAVEIFNMAGQKVFNGTYNDNNITIPVGSFTAGTYMVRVTSDAGTAVRKVVIK